MRVNRPVASTWEKFHLEHRGQGKVAIRTHDGQFYVKLEGGPDGDGLLVANARAVGPWELFDMSTDGGGLTYFRAANGQYITADPKGGLLLATASAPSDWEKFLVTEWAVANDATFTTVYITVYKLADNPIVPIWHSAISLDMKTEYYFDATNRVEECGYKDFSVTFFGLESAFHREMTRQVPLPLADVECILNDVKARWDGERYDLLTRNCILYVNAVLTALGVQGIDRMYLEHDGIQPFLGYVPGSSTLTEVLVWLATGGDLRLDEAFIEDLNKLERIPENIVKVLDGFFERNGLGRPIGGITDILDPLDDWIGNL